MTDLGLKFVHSRPARNNLVRDYLDGSPGACAFLGGSYNDSERVKRLAGKIDKRLDRARLVSILKTQETFGLVERGAERLDRLEREGGFVVTTGQQPVLFGGPLFILYKALTAAVLARKLEVLLGVPVVTVFWNASEDHDFAEIFSFFLLDNEDRLNRTSLPGRGDTNRPACMIQMPEEISTVFAEFDRILEYSGFHGWLREILSEGYAPGSNLGRAFSRLIAGLLGRFGVFVVDACSAELRLHSSELFERELFDSAASFAALESTSRELKKAGYPLQITPLAGDTNLFMIEDGLRTKLQYLEREKAFRLKHTERTIPADELRRILSRYPSSFSPGVLMRPLVESLLFGGLCYVAGPGEISYYAQMGGLYELRGLERPVIRPRLSGFMVERKVGNILDSYGLTPSDLGQDINLLVHRLLRNESEMREISEKLRKIGEFAHHTLSEVGVLAAGIDRTMQPPAEHAGKAFDTVLRKLEQKITSAARRVDRTMQRRLEKAAVGLWPGGEPQERVLAGVQFLARYGPEFLDYIAECAAAELD